MTTHLLLELEETTACGEYPPAIPRSSYTDEPAAITCGNCLRTKQYRRWADLEPTYKGQLDGALVAR